MQQEQSKLSDETMPGITCEIQIRKSGKYNYKFAKLLDEKFNALGNGDEVIVLMPSEHEDLLQQYNDADNFIEKHLFEDLQKQTKEQEQTIQDLKKKNEKIAKEKHDLEKQLDNSASEIKDLQQQLIILDDANKKLRYAHKEQTMTITNNDAKIKDLEQTIADLKEHNDAIARQLEDSVDASEIESLQDEIKQLKEKLATSEKCKDYWQNAHDNLIESSDALTFRNDELVEQNKDLQNKFDEVNNTNKLLNENLIATNTNFKETKQQMQSDFENKEKELKETIKKQQSHIDELTQTKDSLLPLKDNIAQSTHYKEIDALKDKIKAKEKEISKLNSEIESKLASQKSDLSIEHANEKAQLLVAYNQDINNMKLQYNNLAKDYNHLLNGVESLTRINTLMNGKHNEIKKNKEQVPLLEITSEQLPPSDEQVLEYVPKD